MAKKKNKSAKRQSAVRSASVAVQPPALVPESVSDEKEELAAAPSLCQKSPQTMLRELPRAVAGPGRALAFFLLAFVLVILMESERIGYYLDGLAPNPIAEKAAGTVHDLARASGLSWLTARENALVDRYTDPRVIGEKRASGHVAEGADTHPNPNSGAEPKGTDPDGAVTPERAYFLTAGTLGEENTDRPSLSEMERRAFKGIRRPVATVAPPAGIPELGASFRFGAALSGARNLDATSRPVGTVVPDAFAEGFGWKGERSILVRYAGISALPAETSGNSSSLASLDGGANRDASTTSRERIGPAGPATVVTLATPSAPSGSGLSLTEEGIRALAAEAGGEGKRVLMVGDSMMGWGLGHVLERNLSKIPGIKVKRDTRPSTGLSRDDYFNWPKHLNELVDAYNPDLVVVCIGANDGQNILDTSRKRHVVGTASWEATYKQRAEEFIRIAQSKGAQVLWLGLPIVGVEPTGKVLRQLSLLQQAACSHLGTAEFLDNYLVLADEKGLYTAFVEGKNKKQIRIRHKDKIHVTTEGGSILAEYALPSILKLLNRSAPVASVR